MMSRIDLSSTKYAPNALLNWVSEKLQVSSDAALARTLDVAPTVICRMRARRIPIGPVLLIKMHDLLDVPVRDLRRRMGVESEDPADASFTADGNDSVHLTPAEMRAIRLFRTVPEEGRPTFFELMHTICRTCDWGETGHTPGQVIPIDRNLSAEMGK